MKSISAQAIDKVIESLDNLSDEQYEAKMQAFTDAQPVLIAYLFHEENFHLLSEEERGFMQYLALIAWLAIDAEFGEVGMVDEQAIGEAEEANFEALENSTGKNFRKRLDPLFEGYAQEELLAFAEEAVLEDEDDPDGIISKEGRETIFVAIKTVIDVLTEE
ncbi:MAG: hypothetical protein R2792_17620 [Saprospiraceae bacterium]|jgi:hypothetical protein